MKLTYRGVSYELQDFTIETVESEVTGKYRGADFKFRKRKGELIPHSTLRLVYRGLTYLAFGRSWHLYQPGDAPESGESPSTATIDNDDLPNSNG